MQWSLESHGRLWHAHFVQDISNMLYKCPHLASVSVMDVSCRILRLRARGMPLQEAIYCLSQAPLLFTWELECAPPLQDVQRFCLSVCQLAPS